MTRTPHITKSTLSRRLSHLRTNRHAQTKRSTPQKSKIPTKDRAYRPNAGKVDPALGLKGTVQRVCQISSKASPPPKSP
jgi:hypothetical protein